MSLVDSGGEPLRAESPGSPLASTNGDENYQLDSLVLTDLDRRRAPCRWQERFARRALSRARRGRRQGAERVRGDRRRVGLFGRPTLEVVSCSHWPEREDCDHACLQHLVESRTAADRASLVAWYKGKHCALCGARFTRVSRVWDLPAPLDETGITHRWADVGDVAELLPRARPICWKCQFDEMIQRTPERSELSRREPAVTAKPAP
jgi:hypothetical protein